MIENIFNFDKVNSLPAFEIQREEFTCPFCHNRVRRLIPPQYTDWEKVATQWEAYSKKMYMECNLLLSEAGVDTLLQANLRRILERCKQALESKRKPE